MLGREVMLPCTLIAQPPHDTSVSTTYTANFRTTLCDAHQRIRASMNSSARTQKRYFDDRIKQQTFTIGQLVWMYWPLPRIPVRLQTTPVPSDSNTDDAEQRQEHAHTTPESGTLTIYLTLSTLNSTPYV